MDINILPPKPEILAPAGNFEKLHTALLFGADAVYFAGKNFGMRAAADNFDMEEIAQACAVVHGKKKKLYLTTNTVPKSADTGALREYLREIAGMPERPDAFICADLGVASFIQETVPGAHIHISTQANTQNHLTCAVYAKLGFSRVILSRELSLGDIKAIKDKIGDSIELECFVHGSMCVSYSGRCLLSNYLTARDANKGACTQPCRWKYYVVEEKRLSTPLEIEQDMGGTYLFSSRDLCMIDHIDDLVAAGIDSLKIEGRMKSAYYAAVITNAYRMQLDRFYEAPDRFSPDPALRTEVESVSRREYDTGYFYSAPNLDAKINSSSEYIREKSYLAICVGHTGEGYPIFEQRNKLVRGNPVKLLSPGRVSEDFDARVLFDMEGNEIYSTPHPLMRFYIKNDAVKVRDGDIIRSE